MIRRLLGALAAVALALPALAAPRYVPPPITSVSGPNVTLGAESPGTGNAEGWTARLRASPGTLVPNYSFQVRRLGFDQTGAPTFYSDTFTVTRRIRQSVLNETKLRTDGLAALSDYVLASDTVPGATNGSTLVSPVPLCNFTMSSRKVVKDSLYVEAVCFHRNARYGSPVALVRFSVTDDTTTTFCNSTQMAASTLLDSQTNGDRNKVLVYSCSLDTSGMAANHLLTVNAKAYPWIGGAASVAASSTGTVQRDFSPRYFLHNASLYDNPPIAYVCLTSTSCPGQITPTAGTTTGLWSTSASAAVADPFSTMAAALEAIANGKNSGVTGSRMDGLILRIGAGTNAAGGATVSKVQNVATITVTRDPLVARSVAVLSYAATGPKITSGFTSPLTTASLTYKDILLVRSGTGSFGNTTATCDYTFQDVDFDFTSSAVSTMGTNSTAQLFGVTIGPSLGNQFTSGSNETRVVRGVLASNSTTSIIEARLWLGNNFTNITAVNYATGTPVRTEDKTIIAFNRLNANNSAAQDIVGIGATSVTNGYAVIQNVFEFNYTSLSNTGYGFSRDSGSASVYNTMVWYNVFAAWGSSSARGNAFYDETASLYRLHRLNSWVGNIASMVFMKNDRFLAYVGNGTPNPTDGPFHTGGWAPMYGVGFRGSITRFCDNGCIGGDRMWEFPGLRTIVGTSNIADTIANPQFVAYASSYYDSTAGALAQGTGNGDYRTNSNSPCKGLVGMALLPAGLDGSPRSVRNDSCGAYP